MSISLYYRTGHSGDAVIAVAVVAAATRGKSLC